MRLIRVASFYHPGEHGGAPKLSHIRAYTQWYNSTWEGCIEYDIPAANGNEAKRRAREKRLAMEIKK
jgi:hypothetical protein